MKLNVSISLEAEVVEAVDKRAIEAKMNRSQFIEFILNQYVRQAPTFDTMLKVVYEEMKRVQKEAKKRKGA